jgi:hypothetical protein
MAFKNSIIQFNEEITIWYKALFRTKTIHLLLEKRLSLGANPLPPLLGGGCKGVGCPNTTLFHINNEV